jgi:hypothetical protein
MASDWMLRQVRRVDGQVFVETRIERSGRTSISQDMVVEGQEAPDAAILEAWHQLPFEEECWSGRYERQGIVFEF